MFVVCNVKCQNFSVVCEYCFVRVEKLKMQKYSDIHVVDFLTLQYVRLLQFVLKEFDQGKKGVLASHCFHVCFQKTTGPLRQRRKLSPQTHAMIDTCYHTHKHYIQLHPLVTREAPVLLLQTVSSNQRTPKVMIMSKITILTMEGS